MRKLLIGFVFGTAVSLAQATGDFGSNRLISGYTYSHITIRDYFAAQFLAGIAGSSPRVAFNEDVNLIARRAYAIADAMLRAREAK